MFALVLVPRLIIRSVMLTSGVHVLFCDWFEFVVNCVWQGAAV